MARAPRTWAITESKGKNSVCNLRYGPQTRLVRGIYFLGLYFPSLYILVPRGHAPFGQHKKSWLPARSNTGSPRFTDFPSLWACSESSLTNLIGFSLNLLCLQSHSEPESHWTYPEMLLTKTGAVPREQNASFPNPNMEEKDCLMTPKIDGG